MKTTIIRNCLLWSGFVVVALAGPRLAAGQPAPPGKLDALELARRIDQEIDGPIQKAGLSASPLTDDVEFLRRVSLDITGAIPPYAQTTAFLDSKDPDKRTKLIDELLAQPAYSRHMASTWAPRLFIDTSRRIPEPMLTWLEERFRKNQPWDKLVYDIVTATGGVKENGAVAFFQNNNTVADVTEATARAFLGIQLQCAQCHNHPFTTLKKNDYWGIAAFYTKVNKYTAKRGVAPMISEGEGKKNLNDPPEGYKKIAPKFLGGQEPKLDLGKPFRPPLAAWMTAADNPYFARAMVNRTWAHFLGRGLVNPVDDMIDSNAPSHPRLLEEMGTQFCANGFDVKYLIRAIVNSRAYQRSSKPAESSATKREEALRLFGQMPVRALTPRQLDDSRGIIAGKPGGNAFLKHFETREEQDPLEYHNGIPQALLMMNAKLIDPSRSVAKRVVQTAASAEQNVERLCLHVLSRRPTPAESKRWTAHVGRHGAQGYEDLIWAWLNSAEFLLNR